MSEWSTDTRDLVAKIHHEWNLCGCTEIERVHEPFATRLLTALTEAGARVGICGDRAADVFPNGPTRVCDLPAGHAGWHGAPNPPDASGIPSRMSWTVRDEPLVLLDDAPPGPRVWAMPEIPPDVKQVRDSDGEVWTRHEHDGSWAHPDDDPDGLSGTPEDGLIQAFGPLTEVPPNGD